VSHAPLASGGQAYPSWDLLALYNSNATGDFLHVQTLSVPTWNLNATTRRPPVNQAPVAAAYATHAGNRYSVFIINRKLDQFPVAGDDGFTKCTLFLPFQSATRITFFSMTGAARDHNLDGNKVSIEAREIPPAQISNSTFHVDASTGTDQRGVPPGSAFLYTFYV
jgi:hypothetical protein